MVFIDIQYSNLKEISYVVNIVSIYITILDTLYQQSSISNEIKYLQKEKK